jgi:hypothetical protein
MSVRKVTVRSREVGSPAGAVGAFGLGTFAAILGFIAPIVGSIIKLVSPELRKLMGSGLQDWYNKCKTTPNPWDDFLVTFIADILGVTLV